MLDTDHIPAWSSQPEYSEPVVGFGSDNHCGAHPRILAAMASVNGGHLASYGTDMYCQMAMRQFRSIFGPQCDVLYVFNGTAANVLALQSLLSPGDAVICSELAHIHNDECAAPEAHCRSKVLVAESSDGKVTPESIAPLIQRRGDQHHAQPRVLSLTQPTEKGVVYSLSEWDALIEFAHQHQLAVHVDGARLANAAAALGCGLDRLARGVDALSFGGTKNGFVFGEAVVYPGGAPAQARFLRKQLLNLPSKSRFIAAQFYTYLEGGFWRQLAQHENAMAAYLADQLGQVPAVKLAHPTEANGVFAYLPIQAAKSLRKQMFFYFWDRSTGEARLMCCWDTQPTHIDRFVALLRELS